MTNLISLAERVERATAYDPVLAKDIYRELFGAPDLAPASHSYGWREDSSGWWLETGEDQRTPRKSIYPPKWLTSLDAAMTLVPEGWKLRQMNFSAPCADDRKWHLNLHGGDVGQDCFVGRGATMALALLSACLRSLARMKEEEL